MSCFQGLIQNCSCCRYEGSSGLNATEPHHSSEMDEQIMRLKVITSKLQDAYKGRDVSWIDEGKLLPL